MIVKISKGSNEVNKQLFKRLHSLNNLNRGCSQNTHTTTTLQKCGNVIFIH